MSPNDIVSIAGAVAIAIMGIYFRVKFKQSERKFKI